MNSLMFPLTIHSETIAKSPSSIVTPKSGSTFGWWRAFHVTTSLQNVCAITTITMIISSSIRTFGKPWVVTHTCDLINIAFRVHSQYLDCNLAPLMFAHPHIGVPTTVQRVTVWLVKTEWDLKWTRKQSVTTAYLAQRVQTLPLHPRS